MINQEQHQLRKYRAKNQQYIYSRIEELWKYITNNSKEISCFDSKLEKDEIELL